jgi:carbonic anhydrase
MPHHRHDTEQEEPRAGHVHETVDAAVDIRDEWARRRRKGIPTDKQLLVVACMDERIPVEEVLGLTLGDAQVFRNAGGKVTDDIDVACAEQVAYLEERELIPEDVRVHGYVYEVESGHLRRPGERIAEQVNTRVEE